eukprot:NODE_19982_length_819_cov_4.752890.p4 GENE.NODE_19982_length_819_cov_4.752890~~NODE_19982_length_819_cov_4.752890.p4  ORF type:complete len:119 (-),score=33.35 NODE_19982_length_819_cov_4.752890:292-648(-)
MSLLESSIVVDGRVCGSQMAQPVESNGQTYCNLVHATPKEDGSLTIMAGYPPGISGFANLPPTQFVHAKVEEGKDPPIAAGYMPGISGWAFSFPDQADGAAGQQGQGQGMPRRRKKRV